jgi:hypothetical protein
MAERTNGSPIYLSGTWNSAVQSAAARCYGQLGVLVQPSNSYHRRLRYVGAWAADNGCFARGHHFDASAWLRWLDGLPLRERCLFATAPDVVGDARATVERSRPYLRVLRGLGYRPALVAQDGFERIAHTRLVPWPDIDVLFLGGTTAWKTSAAAALSAGLAQALGKRVHMGRVNSLHRLRIATAWGCASADGNFLAFAPDRNLPRALGWFEALDREGWNEVWTGTGAVPAPRWRADEHHVLADLAAQADQSPDPQLRLALSLRR